MALCWGEGHSSSVHDHSDAHCFVKVLDGQLKETMYDWPPTESTTPQSAGDATVPEHDPLTETGVNYYDKDGVTYINGAHHLLPFNSLILPSMHKMRTIAIDDPVARASGGQPVSLSVCHATTPLPGGHYNITVATCYLSYRKKLLHWLTLQVTGSYKLLSLDSS